MPKLIAAIGIAYILTACTSERSLADEQPDLERLMAISALDRDGSLDLEVAEKTVVCDHPKNLPTAHFRILKVDVSSASADFLDRLALAPALSTLRLRRCKLDEECVRKIAAIKSIRSLEMVTCRLQKEAEGLLRLVGTLENFEAHSMPFSDDAMTALTQLRSLRSVALQDVEFGRGSLAMLGRLRELRQLRIVSQDHLSIMTPELGWLSSSKTLEQLSLDGCTLDNETWKAICGCKSLRGLRVRGTNCENGVLKSVALLPELKFLDCSKCAVGNDGVNALPRSLEGLVLDDTAVTQSVAPFVMELAALRELSLKNTKIDFEIGVSNILPKNSRLKMIRLGSTEVRSKGPGPHFPWGTQNALESVSLYAPFGDLAALQISDAKALKKVEFWGNGFTDLALKAVADSKSVELLDITSSQVTDLGISYLSGSKSIRELGLDCRHIGPDSVESLSQMKQLTSLLLVRSRLKHTDIERLRDLLPACDVLAVGE